MQWLNQIDMPDTHGWLEIIILTFIIYYLLQFFRGTRGSSIFSGLIVFFIALYVLTSVIDLNVLNWLLSKLTLYFSLALIIIFQPEIRRGLARLGRQPWGKNEMSYQRDLVGPLVKAAETLSNKKIGALISIEREIGTRTIQDTGTPINAIVTPEILVSLFFPRSPLHDGGVIIAADKICSAGCLFPLSQKEHINKSLGTRHRAGIGITEETDSIAIIISEQTGAISISYNGKLRRGLSIERFERILSSMLGRKKTRLIRFREKIDASEQSSISLETGEKYE